MSKRHYCPECHQELGNKTWWCQPCQKSQFQENFDNWTTGVKEIDDFIKKTQLEATECTEYLELIPFKSLINIFRYETSELTKVYSANWSIGPKDAWDPAECQYVAKRPLTKVALLFINNDPSNFLKEVENFDSYIEKIITVKILLIMMILSNFS